MILVAVRENHGIYCFGSDFGYVSDDSFLDVHGGFRVHHNDAVGADDESIIRTDPVVRTTSAPNPTVGGDAVRLSRIKVGCLAA